MCVCVWVGGLEADTHNKGAQARGAREATTCIGGHHSNAEHDSCADREKEKRRGTRTRRAVKATAQQCGSVWAQGRRGPSWKKITRERERDNQLAIASASRPLLFFSALGLCKAIGMGDALVWVERTAWGEGEAEQRGTTQKRRERERKANDTRSRVCMHTHGYS